MNVSHLCIELSEPPETYSVNHVHDCRDWVEETPSLHNILSLLSSSSIFDNLKTLRLKGIHRHEQVDLLKSILRKGIQVTTNTNIGKGLLDYIKLDMRCEDRIINPDTPPIYTLDLRRKNLYALPATIFALRELEELRLNDNNLTELPAGIGALQNLKILDLEGNDLHSLPHTMGALKHLEHLYLRENPNLREIPPSLLTLPHVHIHHECESAGISTLEDLETFRLQYLERFREALAPHHKIYRTMLIKNLIGLLEQALLRYEKGSQRQRRLARRDLRFVRSLLRIALRELM